MAAHTQESIPPLSSTTAFRLSVILASTLPDSSDAASGTAFRLCTASTNPGPIAQPFSYIFTSLLPYFILSSALDSLCRRVPDEFVQLQPQPHRQAVRQNPFHQRARLQAFPLAIGIGERRRKQHLLDALRERVFAREITRKFIIAPRRQYKFNFVFL